MSNENERDVIDSELPYTLLTAAIGGDALTHMACVAGMNDVFDYLKLMAQKGAMTTPDVEV